ncbi:hypothetical protein TorRG33x02_174080 [Trema orientale]|uniref:Uncharacterized protein n=1 Tax=Trema orientale TaxID=63057 RepID=A0A2P5EMM4_TREOI|nr:hypothetical protein TorRG33x02_174080 [Trema orientale]
MRAVQLENVSVFGSQIFSVSASYICKCCTQLSFHNQRSLPKWNSALDPHFIKHLNQGLSSFVPACEHHMRSDRNSFELEGHRKGGGCHPVRRFCPPFGVPKPQ